MAAGIWPHNKDRCSLLSAFNGRGAERVAAERTAVERRPRTVPSKARFLFWFVFFQTWREGKVHFLAFFAGMIDGDSPYTKQLLHFQQGTSSSLTV